MCFQICHCTEPKCCYTWLLTTRVTKYKCVYTWFECEIEAFQVTDQLVDISVSSQHLEPLHAVKLNVVVDCVSRCCGGLARQGHGVVVTSRMFTVVPENPKETPL